MQSVTSALPSDLASENDRDDSHNVSLNVSNANVKNTPDAAPAALSAHRLNEHDAVNVASNNPCPNESPSSPEPDSRLSRLWHLVPPASSSRSRSELQGSGAFNFKSFKVMTFNTLAQSLVDYKYMENDQLTMSWARRRQEIYKVISESNGDVVCLQEIDELDYINFFKAKIEELGYESVYKRKLQNRLDGILTMFRRERYELVLKRELNFSSENEEYDKPQVALIVALRDKYTTRAGEQEEGAAGTHLSGSNSAPLDDILIVANTHLIFNKSRGDIKLYQICKLLSGLKETYDSVLSQLGPSDAAHATTSASGASGGPELLPSVLICGDLNITPQSLMYNFIFKGFAPLKNTNPRCMSGQYLMFDKTYLTSSSGHNESGETLGNIKHYLSDVYTDSSVSFDVARDTSTASHVNSAYQSFDTANDAPSGTENDNANVARSQKVVHLSSNWYEGVLALLDRTHFTKRPHFVDERAVAEFARLYNQCVLNRCTDEVNAVGSAASERSAAHSVEGSGAEATGPSERNVRSMDLHHTMAEGEHLVREAANEHQAESAPEEAELVAQMKAKLDLSKALNTAASNLLKEGLTGSTNTGATNSAHASNANSCTGAGLLVGPSHSGANPDKLDVIYCPFRLASAYSADDGFNCEPAFTAFHGWQKGCVDYIGYTPENTLIEAIYEMPLYAQVKENGDLPHKKWPASDHFSLISQFKRFK